MHDFESLCEELNFTDTLDELTDKQYLRLLALYVDEAQWCADRNPQVVHFAYHEPLTECEEPVYQKLFRELIPDLFRAKCYGGEVYETAQKKLIEFLEAVYTNYATSSRLTPNTLEARFLECRGGPGETDEHRHFDNIDRARDIGRALG